MRGTLDTMTTAVTATRSASTDAVVCCSPVTGSQLSQPDAEQLAHRLKALGDPGRLRLLSLVAAHDGGEVCGCELTEPVGSGRVEYRR